MSPHTEKCRGKDKTKRRNLKTRKHRGGHGRRSPPTQLNDTDAKNTESGCGRVFEPNHRIAGDEACGQWQKVDAGKTGDDAVGGERDHSCCRNINGGFCVFFFVFSNVVRAGGVRKPRKQENNNKRNKQNLKTENNEKQRTKTKDETSYFITKKKMEFFLER